MGLFLSDAPADVVVTGTPRMLPRLARAVETLGLPVRAVTAERAEAEAAGASLYCIESATLHGSVSRLPAVVVCTSGRVARRAGVACLAASHLTPTRLLGAMIDADLQVNGDFLERFIPNLPGLLMAEFLRHPLALASRQDLCSLPRCLARENPGIAETFGVPMSRAFPHALSRRIVETARAQGD